MWSKYWTFFLLVIWPHVAVGYSEGGSDVKGSNLPFKYELEQVAGEFREKLRKELSILEMEMYEEFLQLIQEIEVNQRNLTGDLSEQLTQKVTYVLEKFTKVMAYSTRRSQVLEDKMKDLMDSLGQWVVHGLKPFVSFNPRGDLQRSDDPEDDLTERSKRHTNHLKNPEDTMDSQEVSNAQKMLELDPDDIQMTEDIEAMDSYLSPSSYFDGHLETDNAQFTLRRFAYDTSSNYVVPKGMPDEGKVEKKIENKLTGMRKDLLPRNCYDLRQNGYTQNGVYVIFPSGKDVGVRVWCDQETAGGGWTVIIGRGVNYPFLNFTRPPIQYAHGFGSPSSNHWIGLEVMHQLTQGISHTLRVHLETKDGIHTYATYNTFRVGSRGEAYGLKVSGYESASTAIDSLSFHSGRPFTYPIPVSEPEGCSRIYGVGWWYLEEPVCYQALPTRHTNRTSEYQPTGHTNRTSEYQPDRQQQGADGETWNPWTDADDNYQSICLMIRPSVA